MHCTPGYTSKVSCNEVTPSPTISTSQSTPREERHLTPAKPIEVLVIEDNPCDVELARLLLEGVGLQHRVNVARNGDEAMQYLAREGRYRERLTPDLVLVDLNLPKLNGLAILEQVEHLRSEGEPVTAVAVWSGCDDARSKDAAEILGADDYFVKAPPGSASYLDLLSRFRAFWDRMSSTGDAG